MSLCRCRRNLPTFPCCSRWQIDVGGADALNQTGPSVLDLVPSSGGRRLHQLQGQGEADAGAGGEAEGHEQGQTDRLRRSG